MQTSGSQKMIEMCKGNTNREPKDVFDDSDADPNDNPDNDSSSDDENPCKRKKDDPASTSRSFVMQSPVLQGEKNVLKNRNIRIKGRYSQKGDTRVVRMDRSDEIMSTTRQKHVRPTSQQIELAVKEVLEKDQSIRSVAKAYTISKSYLATICKAAKSQNAPQYRHRPNIEVSSSEMSLHDSSDDDIFDNSNSAKNVKIVSTKACKVIRKKDTGSAKKGINKCTNNEQDKCVVLIENQQEFQPQDIETDEEEEGTDVLNTTAPPTWSEAAAAIDPFISFAECSKSYNATALINLCIMRNEFLKKNSDSM
ncbi:hypothetical protein QE152_g29910 [Popillia japonica]|uniref:HTH psq-type domain-containing protein n=1 Tax=Popillia japonica TaxID=7064 RepID=A0AAW1JGC1_POPJA